MSPYLNSTRTLSKLMMDLANKMIPWIRLYVQITAKLTIQLNHKKTLLQSLTCLILSKRNLACLKNQSKKTQMGNLQKKGKRQMKLSTQMILRLKMILKRVILNSMKNLKWNSKEYSNKAKVGRIKKNLQKLTKTNLQIYH